MIHGMNHFTVIAEDLDRTLEFYTGLLGLQMGPRPDLGFPGAWLYADGRAILHVYTDRPVPARPPLDSAELLQGRRCVEIVHNGEVYRHAELRRALEPRGHRAIGVVYKPAHERYGNYVPTILPHRYDALIYLERTRALRPLHMAVRRDGEAPVAAHSPSSRSMRPSASAAMPAVHPATAASSRTVFCARLATGRSVRPDPWPHHLSARQDA